MNETRKEIIGLVEPYMNKNISRGCILEMTDGRIEYVVGYSEYEGPGDYIDDMYLLKSDVEVGHKGDNIVKKVLGHYDITAMFKYIEAKNQQSYIDIIGDILKILVKTQNKDLEENYKIFLIPNKPLHLYGEQEEKDLLELLNKLTK